MRMRTFFNRLALGFTLIGLCLLPARAQQAESRFAFVIGNDGYEQGELPTAANDAALVADALRTAGFDVTGARNLDQDTFRSSYREFLAKVSAAGPSAVAAIYISGHGLQLEGENYFVPIGAKIAREGDIGFNAIRISDLIRPLAGLNGRANLVMLDLAHASPFAKEGQPLAPGLAIIEAEPNMLVSMNAAPGMIGPAGAPPYGAYAQALAEMLRSAGATTDEIFDRVRLRTADLSKNQQLPWSVSKLQPPLVLLERGPDAPAPAVEEKKVAEIATGAIRELGPDRGYAAVIKRDRIPDYAEYVETYPQSPYAKNVRGILAARREATIWSRTTALNTPNAYWSYLKRYPRGPHAADARRRLNRLTAPIEPPDQFDVVEYDVPPPPPDEAVYFDGRAPVYIEDAPPPPEIVEIAPPPRWWTPPPPPAYDDDADYFLPAPVDVAPPPWVAPPMYVADPIRPPPHTGMGIAPYVAIPAALAAGIAAGKLLSNKRKPGFTPGGPIAVQPPQVFKPTVMPPVSLPAGQTHTNTGRRPPTPGAIGIPPIAQPPVATQPQGLPTQPVRPPTLPVVPTQPQGGMQGLPTQPVRPPTPPVVPTQPQGGMQGLPTQPVRPPTPTVVPTQPQGGMQGLPTQPVRPPAPPVVPTQPQGGMQGLPTQPVRPPTSPVVPTQPQGGMQGLPTQPVRPPTPPVVPTQPQGGMQGLPTQPVRPPTQPVVPTQPQGGMQGLPTQPVRPPTPGAIQSQPGADAQRLQQQQLLQQQQRQQAEQARQQQLQQQQRQQADQARQQQLQQQQRQQADQVRQQQLQQQRQQAEQARQQQLLQQQRQQADQARQQQLQQQRQQQIQQQQAQQRQQQMLQQQRQQQMIQQQQAQQRQQQMLQQQRQQQIQQQQAQQRQQQMLQQQRQQQMIQQQQAQQRQQQMLQQQRQQQMIQQQQAQQRQQQMLQQQRQQQMQQQQRRCGAPGLPPCR